MKKLLVGKTAIITGASKGIGLATAKLFIEEGANVVLTSTKQHEIDQVVEELKANGGNAIGLEADSGNPKTPKRVFAAAIDAFGQVDILVNNAGYGDMVSIEECSDEHFEMVSQINYFGVFRFCREAVQHFIPRNAGVIVNVTSINGSLPLGGIAYTSTKGAVNTMTTNIAVRFSGTGIRCNAVAPGNTATPMAKAWAAGELAGGSKMVEYAAKYSNQELAYTEAEDQANAILYLASDQAKAVTGRILVVDNGAYIGA
ncbi:SDR family oxidoreductase [Acinetobacter baumannii]|uniref:SDR family NAD(P)-dependent oxidoreductase n=1 Tax=Acinetobacter pittii TaxID=48296 RepID=UPI0026F0B11C|nr:SDR family oxidoreductase [Acinetobacter pittii]MDO7475221.1 SDR family oxidoreductase [Acinetobacter baumannii]MDO7244082.1 SDR family oxidoreductase [Acinetobacter pittii]MDO7505438.1 SDR family oxidoreductase [Acinetobacter baumannii]MDO7508888.1 SDR family oxidoreductase [Acinetobacter baumannii]MDO7523379.1 SDR family oxidoreductase [Acinetobacter baumannii]